MADLKLEKNEIVAGLIVFLLAFGIWHFPEKSTLSDFSFATQLRSALEGKATAFPAQAAAWAQSAYSGVLGVNPSSPNAIVSFLLFFPSLVLALSAVFIYLSARQLEFRRSAAAFGAILFTASLAASTAFLPGDFGSGQFAALFFSLFIFHFSSFVSKGRMLMLLPAALFAALSGYSHAAFGLAGIATVLSFGFPAYRDGDGKKPLWAFAALLLIFAAATFLSPERQFLFFSVKSLQSLFLLSPFLAAAASCAVALWFFRQSKIEFSLLALGGVLASGFSPLAGALLLSLPAAEGISRAAGEKLPRRAMLACAFFLAFFAIAGLASFQFADIKLIAISAMLAVLFPLMLHFYEYKNALLFSLFGLALVMFSIYSAISLFYAISPQAGSFPQYIGNDLAGALEFLSGKNVQGLNLLSSQDAARFYLPSASFGKPSEFSSYLAKGEPKPESGRYLLLLLSDLDDPYLVYQNGTPAYASYGFASNLNGNGAQLSVFVSSGGLPLVREVDSTGAFLLKDGSLIDQYGRQVASVPLSRTLLLDPKRQPQSPQNRLIVIEEGAQMPYFMKIYSGEAGELEKVFESGEATVFKVR